jgi:hypothetical protein
MLAGAVFVGGGLLVARAGRERDPDGRGLAAALVFSGLTWVVASFPAYLLLRETRALWRTQFLSGPGAALVFAGVAALLASLLVPRRGRLAVVLALAAIVIYSGAACAVQRGAFHERGWEVHRRAVVALLHAVPRVTPGTIIVMTDVPKHRDAFGHAYWFDMTMRLAYPNTPVGGIYFFADRSGAPGNGLLVRDGRWQWDGRSAVPLVREGALGQAVVVRFRDDGVVQVADRFPEWLCSGPCATEAYAPHTRIPAGAPPPRVARRYGPL